MRNNGIFRSTTTKTNNFCGQSNNELGFEDGRKQCCMNEGSSSVGDCDSAKWPKGPAFRAILTFAANEGHWLREYTRAWWIATENGHNKDSLIRLGMMKRKRGGRGRGRDECS